MGDIMNRRAVLAGLVGLLPIGTYAQQAMTEVIGGGGAIWRQKVVTVHVYTDARWHPYIQTSFADLKRISGKRLPKFKVQYHDKRDCWGQMEQDFPEGTMVWCSNPEITGAEAWTSTDSKRHGLSFVKIMLRERSLDDSPDFYNQNTTHHELMHAVTWVNDNYGHNPDNSAVHGDLPHYGSHDKKLIQRMYRKNRTRKRGGGHK